MNRLLQSLAFACLLAALGLAAAPRNVLAHGGAHHKSDARTIADASQPSARTDNAEHPAGASFDTAASVPAISVRGHCPSGPDSGCHCGRAVHVGAPEPVAGAPACSLLPDTPYARVTVPQPISVLARPPLQRSAPPRAPPRLPL